MTEVTSRVKRGPFEGRKHHSLRPRLLFFRVPILSLLLNICNTAVSVGHAYLREAFLIFSKASPR